MRGLGREGERKEEERGEEEEQKGEEGLRIGRGRRGRIEEYSIIIVRYNSIRYNI